MSNIVKPAFKTYESDTDHSKGWGSEHWLLNNEKLCCKILKLNKDKKCSMHFHAKKEELFFIVSGSMNFYWIDLETGKECNRKLSADDSVYIPVCLPHQFVGTSQKPCIFVEASTQHFEDDSHRIRGGDGQK